MIVAALYGCTVSQRVAKVNGASCAICLIDQQNLGPSDSYFGNFPFLGDGVTQGFTPTLSGIDALELSMRTVGTSSSIRIDIFAGDGDGEPLLGSSGTLNISNTVFATKHFDFASRVPLTSAHRQ
jgi:hypothetical protein